MSACVAHSSRTLTQISRVPPSREKLLVQGVRLIDCGNAAARAVASLLAVEATSPTPLNASLLREHVLMYLTDYTPAFQTIAKDFLGVPVEEPVRTVLREMS